MATNDTRRHFTGSHYAAVHSAGPVPFLNHTTQYHRLDAPSKATGKEPGPGLPSIDGGETRATASPSQARGEAYHVWRSRDNRKGRHAAVIVGQPPDKKTDGQKDEKERPVNTYVDPLAKRTLKGMLKMVTRYPVWDVSWLVAVIFTLGSAIWCVNGTFAWLPLEAPWTEYEGETDYDAGILAFVGATVFEIGSVFMMLEAVNENRSDCFGWAVEETLEDHGLRLRPGHEGCRHHHQDRRSLLRDSAVAAVAVKTVDTVAKPGGIQGSEGEHNSDRPQRERRWSWWPTWHELSTHYLREIGFLASLSQMVGATIFWISGFTALPDIYNVLSVPLMNGVFWLPQVVGGTGFIVSSFLFMLEVQERWYLPAPKLLGWHVGFWNLIGAIGFTLCGALGFAAESSEAIEYASALSTFIGSWAFLIGSLVQWYESLDKYSISVEKTPSWLPVTAEKVA